MATEFHIEVAVDEETSTTDQGRVLERFAKQFLHTQNFDAEPAVRITAMEVDLYATERTTKERVLVECKAHRSNISAETISKLVGNVNIEGVSAGWLISTHALGKDAKGLQIKWAEKPEEQRRKLRIYPPEALVNRLVAAKLVVDPQTLRVDTKCRRSSESYLLLTQRGEFWALPLIDQATGVPSSVLLFRADDGTAINEREVLSWIAQTNTTLRALTQRGGTNVCRSFASNRSEHGSD